MKVFRNVKSFVAKRLREPKTRFRIMVVSGTTAGATLMTAAWMMDSDRDALIRDGSPEGWALVSGAFVSLVVFLRMAMVPEPEGEHQGTRPEASNRSGSG
ncbi:hypothetical protein HYS42_01155 [Candidatus Saccharibacteria bacterium]|nr:hypothetical protein [Candidatus Saccharibacteria bacterium]